MMIHLFQHEIFGKKKVPICANSHIAKESSILRTWWNQRQHIHFFLQRTFFFSGIESIPFSKYFASNEFGILGSNSSATSEWVGGELLDPNIPYS